MAWVRNRVALAIVGTIIVGIAAAGVAALNTRLPSTSTPVAGAAASVGSSTATTSSAAPTGSAGSRQSTQNGSPTQPPSAPTGELVDLHGTVGKVNQNANRFILNSTPVVAVIVASSTQFQGSISNFQGLRSGMAAEVKGSYQSDGSFVAVLVNAQIDN